MMVLTEAHASASEEGSCLLQHLSAHVEEDRNDSTLYISARSSAEACGPVISINGE
jgi:hypothetical protein